MMDALTIVSTVLGSTVVATIVQGIIHRRKNKAEGRAEQVRGELQVVDASMSLVKTLQEDAANLRAQLQKLDTKVIELEKLLRQERFAKGELEGRIIALEQENARLRGDTSLPPL